MSPRPDVSKERQNQILDAAAEIFSRKGFQKARMDDIASEANLSKGAVYWYFKNKESIIIQIFERIFQRESEYMAELVESNEPAKDRIFAYTDRVIKDINHILKFAPVAFEFLSLAFRNKYFRKAFKNYLHKYMKTLEPIIRQGVDSGEFRDIDPEDAAIALAGVFEGTILLWVYDPNLVNPTYHIHTGMELLMDGFLK